MGIGVKKIGSHALGRCESLQTIKLDAKRMHWENINKDEMWDFETPNFIIHCKDGKIKNKYNRW
jgi:hypothetical protein